MRSNLLFAISLLALAAPASAFEAEVADATIIVTGVRDPGYKIASTESATRTPTSLIDVPQTVDFLSRQRIDDQALLSITDALRYIPGTVAAQGEGNRDQTVIRGSNSTADFFVDGLRDDVQYFRDFYNVERLEILKGPNAMIFGRGGGGGVINRVTKTPLDTEFRGGDLGVDTWGAWRVAGDISQPLSHVVGVRLNAFYEDGANHRQAFDLQRWGLNPTAAIKLGSSSLVLGYEHFEDERTTDRGIPSADGRPLQGFRDTFFGDSDRNRAGVNVDALTLSLDLPLTENLRLRNRSRFADYDKFYTNLFPVTPVTSGQFSVEAYSDITARENLFTQTDLIWTPRTGSIGHVILAGFELGRQSTVSQRRVGFFGETGTVTRVPVILTDPFVPPAFSLRDGPGNRINASRANIAAVFVQDQISLGDHVQLLVGLRHDQFTLDVTNRLSGAVFQRTDSLWSPRVGVVLKPVENASLYGSFSRSYLPQSGDQFTSLDVTTAALEPERFQNYEAGAKWDITPALNLSVALYRIDRTNTRAAGPVAGQIVLTGAQRSEGAEVSLQGALAKGWNLQAGLALQSAEIRTTTAAAPAGTKVPLVPEFQASLWTRHDLSEQFGLGLGITHQGASFTSVSNRVLLPAYTRLDGAVFLKLTDGLQAQINIENLFNTGYFPTAHTDNNISTGGPRAARLTLRARY